MPGAENHLTDQERERIENFAKLPEEVQRHLLTEAVNRNFTDSEIRVSLDYEESPSVEKEGDEERGV